MSDIIYTESQLSAIKKRNKNIIVSAAAGSGKTRVLVDRVIDLLLNDKVNIDKMIIVTFTNKASIEMKDRIRESLEDNLKTSKDPKFIKDQLKLLKYAQIKTLHSFASDMLREYFYYFDNLSPNFTVVSENTNTLLRHEAIDEVFDEEYLKMNKEFESFLHNFTTSRNDREGKNIILSTYDTILSYVDPIKWLDEMTSSTFDFAIYKKEIKKQIGDVLTTSYNLLSFAKENSMRDKYIELLTDDYYLIQKLYKLLEKDDDNLWDKFIEDISKLKFKAISRASKEDDLDVRSKVHNTRNNYKDALKSISSLLINSYSDTVYKFSQMEREILKEINYLTKRFMEKYEKKKRDKSYLDFNDMEHFFITLLDNEEARKIISDRFKYIFFDEYQDSNEIQNYIIEELKKENNLFFVGDVKQSIYGFRRAKPKLFLEKLDSYEMEENINSERINLNENFRSDKDILDFNNYIFEKLMTKENSDIDYKNGGHRLNAEKKYDGKSPKTSIRILDSNVKEGNHIASIIEDLIKEGYEYRDIAILLRSGAKSYIYEESLKRSSIPFFNDISKVSFSAVEVMFFISMLKYISNPKDDVTLLSVLQSSIFNFTEDELSKIRLSSPDTSFYEAFNNYNEDDYLFDKISDFHTAFINYRYELTLMSLYEFGNFLFENSGYYDFLMARDRAADRITNVESFIDLLSEYESTNDNGLFGFLNYIEDLSDKRSDRINTTRDLSENENLVRMMTIHKSKGLEFPVVILADSGKRFNIMHLRSNISFDDELGIGINVADYENKIKISSIKRDLINEKISIENKKEEMRILYVALTRAMEKLYIVGERNISTMDKLKSRDDYLNMSTYLDRIIAILSDDKVSEDIFEGDYLTDEFKGEVDISIIDQDREIEKNKNQDILTFLESTNYNEKLFDKFRSIYNSKYKYIEDTKESVKKSVTEISKNFNPEDDGYELPSYELLDLKMEFKKPNFITEKKEFKPTDRGTIIHKIFEALPFRKYDEKKLERALSRLIIEKKLNKDELKVVDNDKLLSYYNNNYIYYFYENAKSIRHEESFLMKYEDYYINGQIDVMFEFDDHIILLDFKTDTIKREGLYDDQLKIYKLAIEEALNKPVRKSLIYRYNFEEFEEID